MKLTRREFLKCCAGGAAGAALPGCISTRGGDGTKERPNILWLVAEDISPDLACYGHPLVRTPNIDRLAAEGAQFTNAFSAGPVCSATRSALMTGTYQTAIGAHNHRSNHMNDRDLPEPVRIITEYFRDAGYYTSNCSNTDRGSAGKTDLNFNTPYTFDGTDWRAREAGQLFYAQVNFSKTHREFKRDPANPIDPDLVDFPSCYPDDPVTRRDWADYLEHIQLLDKDVGVVLGWLEDEGLVENTVVLFFGDHGRAHVRGKQFLYEGGIHIPLIVRWPGHVARGTVVDDLVSQVDFAPTCLRLAGAEVPAHMQGRAFLGPEAGTREYVYAARDRCDETVDRIRCCRSKRYKYIRNFFPERPYMQLNRYKKRQYPVWTLLEVLDSRGELTPEQAAFTAATRPEEELYDLATDPHEVTNLAGDPAHRFVLQELRYELDRWIAQTGDQGEIAEDQATIDYWTQRAIDKYETTMQNRGLDPAITPEDFLDWWRQKLGVA